MALRGFKRLLDWRSMLVYTHRWLGIVGCLLFIGWFFSGIVMMYARMPSLANEERLARATPLDLRTATIEPAEAAEKAGATSGGLQVSMLQDRPVYRFGGGNARRSRERGNGGSRVIFADTGEPFKGIDRAQALAAARRFEPDHTGTFRHEAYMVEPDQWTLQAQGSMPMHRFALDDAAGTKLYVSETSGEVVLRTTRRERIWGFLGPVIHWVYFTPIRKNGSVWTEVVIWSSLAGCLMCVVGLVWGVLRFSPFARFRIRREPARSPYVGMMKWHHYTGLVFGVITFTWTYSGLLSMGPFDWFQPEGGRQARGGGGDGRIDLSAITLTHLRAVQESMSASGAPKTLETMRFQNATYWVSEQAPPVSEADAWRSPSLLPRSPRPPLVRHYVSADRPDAGTFTRFPRAAMSQVAEAAMPGVKVREEVWLTEFDAYYYDARSTRTLPVLRVRYDDPQETWVYVDPARGAVVQRSEKVTRLRRWLYQGLHSLDFPFLYYHRPLWDIVVIVLSLGGLALSVTTITPAWRRLVRHGRKWGARIVPRQTPAAPPQRQPAMQQATDAPVRTTSTGAI